MQELSLHSIGRPKLPGPFYFFLLIPVLFFSHFCTRKSLIVSIANIIWTYS